LKDETLESIEKKYSHNHYKDIFPYIEEATLKKFSSLMFTLIIMEE